MSLDTVARPRPAPTTPTPEHPVLRDGARTAKLTILALGLVIAVWPVINALQLGLSLQLPVVVAHVTGMLAGYGVVVLVGLMSRSPWLERTVGADRLARWHSLGGRIVVSLVLLHAGSAVLAWAQSRRESGWLALWHVLRLPGLIAASISTVMFLAVAVLSVRAARRRVSFETWHAVHLLVYLAVALSFLHQLGGPDLAGHRLIQLVWALLYTQVFAMVLAHRVITPIRMARRHLMRVAAVYPQGPGVVSIVISGQHLDELHAESGQFFRWRFLDPRLWLTAHPFSLSAAPTATRLRLTVKTLGDGSGRLQQLEPGTWVLAEGPYGVMTSRRATSRNVLLIAGGVGITPMRALFESLPLRPGQDLLLLYRARTRADLLFAEELGELAQARGARISYLVGDAGDALTARGLLRTVPDLVARDAFLCGPPGFSEAVRRALLDAGHPRAQLHEERFTF